MKRLNFGERLVGNRCFLKCNCFPAQGKLIKFLKEVSKPFKQKESFKRIKNPNKIDLGTLSKICF